MDAKDLARDNTGTKAYTLFLVDVAARVPMTILPNISVILCHLDEESYMMRMGVLGLIAEILIHGLSKEQLDVKEKKARDQFMDILEDHIHDVNAFVRSRVLQIWLRICNARAIPLSRHKDVMNLTIGRLEDKSSLVRKQAIQLISVFLSSNPFAAKLPVQDLRTKLEEEKNKLKEMIDAQPENAINLIGSKVDTWNKIEKDVTVAVQEVCKSETEKQEFSGDVDVDSVLDDIYKLLEQEHFNQATLLLLSAMEEFPGNELFRTTPLGSQDDSFLQTQESTEENSESLEPSSELNKEEIRVLNTLKAVFLSWHDDDEGPIPAPIELSPSTMKSTNQEDDIVNDVSKQQILVQYLKDCVSFASQIQTAVPLICKLLSSKTPSDVMEAIDFFVTAFEFGVSNSLEGVRQMLALIWSKEPSVKEAIVAAYKRLYLNTTANNNRAQSVAVVKNLTALIHGATVGELKSLEALVMEFVENQEINNNVIQVLWERFTLKIPGTSTDESKAALLLLAMAAKSDVNVVRSNIDVLVSTGLSERAHDDFMLARDSCIALLKLIQKKKVKGGEAEEPFRFPKDHEMFDKLTELIVKGISKLDDPFWVPMTEQAINVIYRLGEQPDIRCASIIKQLIEVVLGDSEQDDLKNVEPKCHPRVLARFLAFAGHVAFQQLYYLDVSMLGELKRRRNIQDNRREAEKNKAAKNKRKSKDGNEPSMEEDMGLTGAVADDAEAEYMKKVLDTEIVTGNSLLAMLSPLITAVCSNHTKYSDSVLKTAAAMALAKFMLVSSEFCEAHLQLLFTVLEKSSEATIRANTIIALGDLTFRFPNLIEPWTPNLYARLRDDSPMVRKNTLTILTHLILNDMVKVKGQISEMAICIVDEDDRISNMSKMFFHELAKKGNAVYNIMPDVISRLSDPEVGVKEENFKIIMRYLFSFIQKDKQCESLVEKLCHRFRTTRTDRQVRDLAFCLAMLNYSEKGIRKLQENFVCFGDKLADEEVYNCFQNVITKSKKFAKPEVKVIVDELEAKLLECHTKGMSDDQTTQKALQVRNKKTPGKSLKGKTPARRRVRSGKDVDSDDEYNPGTKGMRRSTRKPSGDKTKKKILSFSDEDDSDLDLFDVQEVEEEGKKSNEIDKKLKALNDSLNSAEENNDPNLEPSPSSRRTSKRRLLPTGRSRTRSGVNS
ncbi:condensin complex subunit 1-like [Saccoglossus kowalevskii]